MNIQGCDLSRWNSDTQFKNLLAENTSFFIMKATEGRTYQDAAFLKRADEVQRAGLGLAAYHFARPDNNMLAKREAENFIKVMMKLREPCVVALDWEDKAESYSQDWILSWCDVIEKELGRKPMIYVNHAFATTKAFADISKYPLWCAKWGDEPTGKIGPWDGYTIWQYTNTPYDKDVFNGSLEQFKEIGLKKQEEEVGHYCGCCCCKK